jgi:NAD(P)-dependent dehydrogenase (short-subunit alcohol dehydrogenase family)
LFLARLRRTRFRIARLDLATKALFPDHPIRHALNAVIALHECDSQGYRQMASTPIGGPAFVSLLRWIFEFGLSLAITTPWLGWQYLIYIAGAPFRFDEDLAGKRVLITGVNRGLGKDLMLHCLEQGANIIGTVRTREALEGLAAQLPAEAPVKLLVVDLALPGAFAAGLLEAQVPAASIDIAILSAGTKYAGTSVLNATKLRETFQVNLFSAAEFTSWLRTSDSVTVPSHGSGLDTGPCHAIGTDQAPGARALSSLSPAGGARKHQAPSRPTLVIVSSMGRWHGMHFSCGYNASKAALSIWAESLEMEMLVSGTRPVAVTVVEPGMFESEMTKPTPLTRLLLTPRRSVARRIVSGALAGRRVLRPPFWFALVTWGLCLAGRGLRFRVLARVTK